MLTANSPFSLIIFGASGHLAKIKIYPALYILFLKKRLPEKFTLVGYARTAMSREQFQEIVSDAIHADLSEVNPKTLQEFLKHVQYQAGQYDAAADFASLANNLSAWEDGGEAVRLAYLSVPPAVFPPILENLSQSGVRRGEFRCIVEKPVGSDLATFNELKDQLMASFSPNEVFLLDHYLGKEAVRNLYYLRAGNPVFERVFESDLIQHIEVTAIEAAGIESRAGYFEASGTLRDMVQSHLLMIVSLLTMRLTDEAGIQKSRLESLRQIAVPAVKNLSEVLLQGQYAAAGEVKGYHDEDDVTPGSRTNTFIALKLESRDKRFQYIPFFLRSGKRLDRKETRVSIQFKPIAGEIAGSTPNQLDVILQGEAGLKLHLQTKLGGSEPAFRPLVLADPLVCVGDCLPEHGLLLLEAINGIRRWFLDPEEVATAWALVDPLQRHCDDPATPLVAYPAGSRGPVELQEWTARQGITWMTC